MSDGAPRPGWAGAAVGTTDPVTQTMTGAQATELAVVERSGFIESRHVGSAVVLGPDGAVARSVGAPEAPVFPRSTLKPFQAIASIGAGAPLTGEKAAIASASHRGTAGHVALVRSILNDAGVGESALQCPEAWPLDGATRAELNRQGASPSRVYMSCSGKHAAFISACVASGWPIEGHLDPGHPLQKAVRDTVERFTGEKVLRTGVDGCGAPVHAMSLVSLARGIQRFATSSASSPFALYRNAALVHRAALENPWVLEGEERPDTIATERLGVFVKGGAEGLTVVGTADGTAIAVKVLDGSSRASTLIALRLLQQADGVNVAHIEETIARLDLRVRGGVEAVGEIRAVV